MNGSTLSSKPQDEEHSQQTCQSSFICAIHSLQLVPVNITGTREFAGEITGSKGLGFYTAHLYKGYFTLQKT